MRIKVNDRWYDGDKQLVMVVLTESDKENIRDMSPEATRYCQYPKALNLKDNAVFEWMMAETDDS